MNYARRPGIDSDALRRLAAREAAKFPAPRIASRRGWRKPAPRTGSMACPCTGCATGARRIRCSCGARAASSCEDVDGNHYVDFCFGDTGAMFGHSPPAIARALAETGRRGHHRDAASGARGARRREARQLVRPAVLADDADRDRRQSRGACAGRAPSPGARASWSSTAAITAPSTRPWCARFAEMKDKGGTRARAGLIGMNHDVSAATDAVPFNDAGRARARAGARPHRGGDRRAGDDQHRHGAAGGGLPAQPARAHAPARRAARSSTRRTPCRARVGGYARAQNLEPDIWVCGKAIAGGMPCAVFGFTAEVEAGMRRVQQDRAGGHSGMGTTLSANALALACLEASLDELMTPANYQAMHDTAAYLSEGLGRLFAARDAALARGARRRAAGVRFRQAAAQRRRIRARGVARARTRHPSLPAQSRRAAHAVPQHDAVLAGHHHGACRHAAAGTCRTACAKSAAAA